jgi:tRNA nucleotidyltransferase/poly(A) polymerase
MRSFQDFILYKEEKEEKKDWKKEFIQLEKGFIPPDKMKPIIQAFLDSNDIQIMRDTSKEIKLPKKSLFLCGGSVRDFLKGKTPQGYHLATNATPPQIALILHSAGFKYSGDTPPQSLKLTFEPKGDPKVRSWKEGGSDNKGNYYSIIAEYKGEEFEIYTLKKDPKVSGAQSAKEFVDSPVEDSGTRDLTINALYIELSKPDGENNKLYDPTEKGWHDAKNGVIRTVGNAEDRFSEDQTRILRAIRFHCRFGKGGKLDSDIEKALTKFKNLDGVELEKVRDEFLKGLLHPDTDAQRYIDIYHKTGLINKLFPNIEINTEIPKEFSAKRDKALALAWLLQNNDVEDVADALAPSRVINDKECKTGWNQEEKRAVLFLLFLKEFTPEQRPEFLDAWKGTGLTKEQIKDWVEMFNTTDSRGRKRNLRPTWAVHVKTFADNEFPLAGPKDVQHVPLFSQPSALDGLEVEKFLKALF